MRLRKVVRGLLLCAGLALVALLIAIGTEVARRPSLDARLKEAHSRVRESRDRFWQLVVEDAPKGDLEQAGQDLAKAEKEEKDLEIQRMYSWHARLRREVRRRTSW
jgi:hypothetical protein